MRSEFERRRASAKATLSLFISISLHNVFCTCFSLALHMSFPLPLSIWYEGRFRFTAALKSTMSPVWWGIFPFWSSTEKFSVGIFHGKRFPLELSAEKHLVCYYNYLHNYIQDWIVFWDCLPQNCSAEKLRFWKLLRFWKFWLLLATTRTRKKDYRRIDMNCYVLFSWVWRI